MESRSPDAHGGAVFVLIGQVTRYPYYEAYRRERDKRVATGEPMLINDEHWGLGGEELPERRVA